MPLVARVIKSQNYNLHSGAEQGFEKIGHHRSKSVVHCKQDDECQHKKPGQTNEYLKHLETKPQGDQSCEKNEKRFF
jgi:hypothetical protein